MKRSTFGVRFFGVAAALFLALWMGSRDGARHSAAEEKPAAVAAPAVAEAATASPAAALETARALETIKVLASDEFEGRGPGTKGIDKAAAYIAGEFQKLGLKTELFNGGPYQAFNINVGAELGPKNQLAIVGPPGPDGKPRRYELKLGVDYTPLSIGGSGKIDVPVVFVGYGITAKKTTQAPADPHGNPHANPHAAPSATPPVKPAAPTSAAKPATAATAKPATTTTQPAAKPEDEMLYDDYAGIDVKGKCVVVFRHQPQQGNPHGILPGVPNSPHAPFVRKLSNAYEHGAAAVIFVTTDHDIRSRLEVRRKQWRTAVDDLAAANAEFKKLKQPTAEQAAEHRKKIDGLARQVLDHSKKLDDERDPLLGFQAAGGTGDASRLPALHAVRGVWDRVMTDAGKPDLAAIERKIDEGPQPESFPLEGWRIEGEVDVKRVDAEVKNVVAVLEGEGPAAEETIVVGAHYDHLGYGEFGSFEPDVRAVHNGADDNASGTTALLEVARLLSSRDKRPARRIVFIAFTGEERGLYGSAEYCKQPLYPLANTVAMLNMDMVGRLNDEKLIVYGADTAKEFTNIVDKLNAETYHFKLTHTGGGFGPSDHASFYAKKIPVLHFFTGLHKEYHRPSDDVEKINADGLIRIAHMVSDVAAALADAPSRPTYQESKTKPSGGNKSGDRPYFGSIPDFAQSETGYGISGVTKDSPADKGGLKGGDIIVKLGGSQIGNLDDFDSALRKYKAGDKVPVVVRRDGKNVTLNVTLGAPQ